MPLDRNHVNLDSTGLGAFVAYRPEADADGRLAGDSPSKNSALVERSPEPCLGLKDLRRRMQNVCERPSCCIGAAGESFGPSKKFGSSSPCGVWCGFRSAAQASLQSPGCSCGLHGLWAGLAWVGRFIAGVLYALLFGCGVWSIALVRVVVKVDCKSRNLSLSTSLLTIKRRLWHYVAVGIAVDCKAQRFIRTIWNRARASKHRSSSLRRWFADDTLLKSQGFSTTLDTSRFPQPTSTRW